ncbi:MAG TPA: permease-like cell division protein FtsX [Nitrosospira sp.]|nr:permease-like cell division protein FtsX [Nitrosospira sp.]
MSVWLSHHFQALVLALKRLLRSPLGSLLSISVIGIAFSLPAGIYVMLENLQAVAGQFSAAPQLSLFLKLNSGEEAVSEVKTRLEHHPNITTFQFVSKENALREFSQSTGLADIAESFEQNPLPDAFVITASSLSSGQLDGLHAELQKWPEIEHVQLDSAWARRLEAMLNLGRLAVLMLSGLLSVALLVVTFNVIRLQILTMRDEIEVSKLIGATNGFIRRPFLYFGALQGAAGGIVGWLIISLGIHLIDEQLKSLMQLYDVNWQLYHLSLEDSLSLLLFSALLGWTGAWLSVGRHLGQIEPR